MAVVLMVWVGNPFLSAGIWLLCFFDYIGLAGWRKTVRMFGYSILAAAMCVVLNPLLNHRGVTLLFMLGEWRITKESLLYGFYMAGILLASLVLFSCLSHYMTAEKIMTLFGKRFSSFALLFSMILRLVPKAGKDFREMTSRHGSRPSVWSALIGISLEDAMERSLSMKGREYGSEGRSSFYAKKFTLKDRVLLAVVLCVSAVVIIYLVWHPITVRFFPSVKMDALPFWLWLLLFFYYMIPLGLRGKEELTWYWWRRKITDSDIREKSRMQSGFGNYR
jgi:energy-coupling factor transport system permease protein